MAISHFMLKFYFFLVWLFSNWVKRIQIIANKNNIIFSINKNNVFTQLNLRDHRPILKTYHFLRWVVVFHLGAWLCTPNILTLQAACEPVIILSMCPGSFTNSGFACHAPRTLCVRWILSFVFNNSLYIFDFFKKVHHVAGGCCQEGFFQITWIKIFF